MSIPIDALRIIRRTLEKEGHYSNDEYDKGGETKYGISKRAHPTEDIANLTIERAIQIYYEQYYLPLNPEQIKSIRVRWKLFDFGVNAGVKTSARLLQRVIDVSVDGIIGNATINRVNELGELDVLLRFMRGMANYYIELVLADRTQLRFLRGWLNARAFDLGEALNHDA